MYEQTPKIKFAIGTPDSIWTSAWFIATNPKGDVYIGNAGFTSAIKLSFHASGLAQFKYYDRPEFGALANKSVQRWKRPPTPAQGGTHVFSVHFPTDFLHARMPHNYRTQFLAIAPASAGEAIEVGLFYSRGLRVEHIQHLGKILLFRRFPTGEDVWAVQRSAPFDASKVARLSQLRSGSLKLPVAADWMSPEFAPGRSLDSAGVIFLGDPEKDGLAQAVEVTGLRAEYTPAAVQS
ncbi:MAG TPA: hypothetical protein VMS87_07370 [Roseiarcus sp.]|nr:hypothetical protein [Roseiarcus sp.]